MKDPNTRYSSIHTVTYSTSTLKRPLAETDTKVQRQVLSTRTSSFVSFSSSKNHDQDKENGSSDTKKRKIADTARKPLEPIHIQPMNIPQPSTVIFRQPDLSFTTFSGTKPSPDMNISSLDEIKDNFTSPIGDLLREHVSLTDLFIPELSNNIIKQTLAKLVGPCYPMVGTITLYSDKRYAYSSLYDGTKKDIANTSGFVFYSYNRLSRILMAMGLGRALIFVKFVNGNENNAELMDLKMQACNDGITYNDVHYTFFNASNSSLNTNDGSCVFLASCIDRPYLISLLGNFEECAKQGVGKLIARIAMSNGKSYMSNEQLQKREIFMLQDEDEFPCADGCGMMREDKFERTLEQTNAQPFHAKEVIPYFKENEIAKISAIQIRVHGFKGVVQKVSHKHWRGLQQIHGFTDDVTCLMRPSMKKYETNIDIYPFIDVLKSSSVIEGSVHRTFMSCMLNLTTKKDEMSQLFIHWLEKYLKEKIHLDRSNASELKKKCLNLCTNYRFKTQIEHGFEPNFPLIANHIGDSITKTCEKLVRKNLSLKMHLKQTAVRLMGVIDESIENALLPNQVFIHCDTLTLENLYKIKQAIIYRDPLVYEGDIQKLEIVLIPPNEYLASLRNVIVFPKVAKDQLAPHQKMGGGDLDGDWYCIIFDQELCSLMDKEPNFINYDANKQARKSQTFTLSYEEIRTETIRRYCSPNFEISTLDKLCMYIRPHENESLKKELAKSYHDAIGSSKGEAIDHSQVIQYVQFLYGPSGWTSLCNEVKFNNGNVNFVIPSHIDLKWNCFELGLILKVIDTYTVEMKNWDNISRQHDWLNFFDELELIWVRYSGLEVIPSPEEKKSWKLKFEKGYKEWQEHWTAALRDEPVLAISKDDKCFLSSLKKHLSSEHPPPNNVVLKWTTKFAKDEKGEFLPFKALVWFQKAFETDQAKNYKSEFRTCGSFLFTSCSIYLKLVNDATRSFVNDFSE